MTPQFMAFLFEPSVRSLSLRDLNHDDQIAPADAAIAAGGSASCDARRR